MASKGEFLSARGEEISSMVRSMMTASIRKYCRQNDVPHLSNKKFAAHAGINSGTLWYWDFDTKRKSTFSLFYTLLTALGQDVPQALFDAERNCSMREILPFRRPVHLQKVDRLKGKAVTTALIQEVVALCKKQDLTVTELAKGIGGRVEAVHRSLRLWSQRNEFHSDPSLALFHDMARFLGSSLGSLVWRAERVPPQF